VTRTPTYSVELHDKTHGKNETWEASVTRLADGKVCDTESAPTRGEALERAFSWIAHETGAHPATGCLYVCDDGNIV